ncbi:glycosyltransferase [Chondrinema litorale]|uniref:glycosyltransferase n=1 Tax=Chondrinema litorale TaxID=2994555 RepID=UPI002543F2EA|nr:glycosyltransferase [Chondrinema litorale]UZR95463.1 glycosyltransferase [Chondrinema litorale]
MKEKKFPLVSVFVAVRDEEENIIACLSTLLAQNYPKECFEVLIGNDQSTDNTVELVESFIDSLPNFKLIHINGFKGEARGKANVLAHLAEVATGDFFLVTDADMHLPINWIEGMMNFAKKRVGIVTGYTIPKSNSIFSALQAIDWLNAQAQIYLMAQLNIPVTSLGNNMLISKEAYLETGGYEKIPFSITEDFELFQQVVNKGWTFAHPFYKVPAGITIPVESLPLLLKQRKRWMHGAMQIKWYLKWALVLDALFLPFVLLMLFFFPIVALTLFVCRFLLVTILTSFIITQTDQIPLLKYVLLFDVYHQALSFLLISSYTFSREVEWKGRAYKV